MASRNDAKENKAYGKNTIEFDKLKEVYKNAVDDIEFARTAVGE
jgi:hypothetical protein